MNYLNIKQLYVDFINKLNVYVFLYYTLVIWYCLDLQQDYLFLNDKIENIKAFLIAYDDLSLFLSTVCFVIGVTINVSAFEIGYKLVENDTIVNWKVFGQRLIDIALIVWVIEIPIYIRNALFESDFRAIYLLAMYMMYLGIIITIISGVKKIKEKIFR